MPTISCSLFYNFSSVRRLSATYALKAHPLRLPQVLKYQLHLPSGESARGTLVSYSLQLREQSVGGGDVLVQQAQGRGARGTGEVELGELTFGEGRGKERPTPNPSLYGGELADIVGIHNCVVFRVVRC